MTEQNQVADQQTAQPTFDMRRVYLKDASLEIPNAPEVFLEVNEPKVHIEVSIENQVLGNDAYDVTVSVTATATVEEKTFFLVEAKQAGVFEMAHIPEEQLEKILNIVCPSMLFPYLRANVSDLLTRATLPPLYLAEINFEQLYQAQLEQAHATKQ
ncbi:MAG: secB [Burkholderiaceae bacterium]|nr:secB [Burkholderiaceae bacterium]